MTALVVRPITVARERLLATALDLFFQHGVGGTSLPMVADRLGVARSSVLHQFPTKTDLLLALLAPALDTMAQVAETAEAQRSVTGRREAALSGLVDLVVANRRLAAVMYADHSVSQLFREHPPLLALSRRLNQLLLGPKADPDRLVSVAVVGGGLMMVSLDPGLADLDNETLRRHLLCSARRALGLPTPRAASLR